MLRKLVGFARRSVEGDWVEFAPAGIAVCDAHNALVEFERKLAVGVIEARNSCQRHERGYQCRRRRPLLWEADEVAADVPVPDVATVNVVVEGTVATVKVVLI